jgi:hypothetical protein
MACEATNTNLGARTAVITTTAIADVGYCKVCGKCCCNCATCMRTSGKAFNVCTQCHEAAKPKAAKAGAA